MKEATGELNMTVVTLIAIAAIGGLFYVAIWPMVQRMLVQQTCNTYGPDFQAIKNTAASKGTGAGAAGSSNSQAEVFEWVCCPSGAQGITGNASLESLTAAGCIGAK